MERIFEYKYSRFIKDDTTYNWLVIDTDNKEHYFYASFPLLASHYDIYKVVIYRV